MFEVNWDDIQSNLNLNQAYTKITSVNDENFPIKKVKVINKDLLSPWITDAIKKSSERKQRLYEKFFKIRNKTNETTYKNYKSLFEAVNKQSEKLYFSSLILNYNIKKTSEVIKESLGK